MSAKIIAILASASLASASAYGVSATRAADVLPGAPSTFMGEGQGSGAEQCRVDVIRTGQPGVATVTRDTLANGGCLCTVTTGPKAGNGAAEDIVTALERDKTCAGAPAPANAGNPGTGQAAGGGGASGGVLGGVVGAVAVGGLAAGLGKKSKG